MKSFQEMDGSRVSAYQKTGEKVSKTAVGNNALAGDVKAKAVSTNEGYVFPQEETKESTSRGNKRSREELTAEERLERRLEANRRSAAASRRRKKEMKEGKSAWSDQLTSGMSSSSSKASGQTAVADYLEDEDSGEDDPECAERAAKKGRLTVEERLERRLEANRKSAAASRKRRLDKIDELKENVAEMEDKIESLQRENERLMRLTIQGEERNRHEMDHAAVLQRENTELRLRLQRLELLSGLGPYRSTALSVPGFAAAGVSSLRAMDFHGEAMGSAAFPSQLLGQPLRRREPNPLDAPWGDSVGGGVSGREKERISP